jgi:hypothetical protein
MGNKNRHTSRRKYQNDIRSRERAAKMSDVHQQPQIEEKLFSEAEAKTFMRKYEVYQKAKAAVDEFIEFLGEQHGVEEGSGWNLSERGWTRPIAPSNNGSGANGNGMNGNGNGHEEGSAKRQRKGVLTPE